MGTESGCKSVAERAKSDLGKSVKFKVLTLGMNNKLSFIRKNDLYGQSTGAGCCLNLNHQERYCGKFGLKNAILN